MEQATPNTPTGLNLDNVDGIILLDKSGSMDEPHKPGITRWQAGKESISAFAEELSSHDDDGITVAFFDTSYSIEDHVTPDKVDQIFAKRSPGGSTNLAAPLQKIIDMFLPAVQGEHDEDVFENRDKFEEREAREGGFLGMGGKLVKKQVKVGTERVKVGTRKVKGGGYLRQSPKKQVFICVLTDGAAGDETRVIEVLRDATKRIVSRRDLGLLFIQVGDDSSAEAFLDRLNNNLEGDFDIVAVEKLEALEKLSTEQIIAKAFTE